MMRSLVACLALVGISAHAEDVRIYQTDKYGHVQFSNPSYTINPNGRIIQTDAHGNKLYHKQQYQITGDRIVPVSTLGYRQYSKPALVIEGSKSAIR